MNLRPPGPFAAALVLLVSVPAQPQQPPPERKQTLKEQMRAPWSRSDERFIRRWLVLSEFPLAGGGFDKDWLVEHGGEAAIRPAENMAHRLPDGSSIRWRAVTAWNDATDLAAGPGLKRDLVGYAATTVTRPAAGKALLSIGSDESIRVWVNGSQVLDRRARRQLTYDEDRVEVDLKAGGNAILVKLEQRTGPWHFSTRVLESGAIPPRVQEIGPSLLDDSGAVLTLRTDADSERASLDKVRVQAVGAGGRTVADIMATRGETLRLNASAWPAGAYEIRLSTRRMNGLLYATHIPWYKGDAIAAARELTAAGAKADARTAWGATVKMLADMVVDRLGKDFAAVGENPWWAIHSPLMEFEELKLEAAGKPARDRPYGFVRLAYFDEVDGSIQFCRAYLPGGWDPAKKWPMVVRLHGYNPENPDYVRWWSVDVRHLIADSEYNGGQGVIYLEPHGRGNTNYLGLGDRDVMRVIEMARRRFHVDDDRVYLAGESMGGWGVWNVATRHPDAFAAIAPVYGGSDYHSQVGEAELSRLGTLDRFQLEKESSWAMAEGLLHTPILVYHGDVDQSVNIEYSRYGVRLLERWGYNVRYVEMPGYGHEELNVWPKIVEWLIEHRRVADPARVRIRSAEPGHASAYWVRIGQAASSGEFMLADAEATGPNTIRLDTKNVLALTLTPGWGLANPAKPLKVVWNGEAREVRLEKGAAVLRAAGYQPGALEKNAEISGPVADIFNTPFAIVEGTASADPAMNDVCRRKSQAVAKLWRDWQRQPARVFRDSELTDADTARYSLLLVGGPEANLVARKFAGRIPIDISPDRIRIGGRSFPAADARVQAIFPNPLNPRRYVAVVAATSAGAMSFWAPDRLRSAAFDFTIEDGHFPSGEQRVPDSDLWVAGGWFDPNWRLRDDLVFEGKPEARAKNMVLRVPQPGRPIDSELYDACAGRYLLGPVAAIVRREGPRLLVKVGPQPELELLPISGTEFVVVEGPARLVFEKDVSGAVAGFSVWQGGQRYNLKRQP